MIVHLIITLTIFLTLLLWLIRMRKKRWSLSRQVMLGLIVGVSYGLLLQFVYGADNPVVDKTMLWLDVIGNGYVKLLQMVIMPLVFVSILSAVSRMYNASSLGKISFYAIGVLLLTTAIAALVGVAVVLLFHLSAEGLVQGAQESQRLQTIQTDYVSKISALTTPMLILSFIPSNPFAALTGFGPTSIISVVVFTLFLGLATLRLIKEETIQGQRILVGIDTLQTLVMRLVRLVIQLTPYGVMALMTKVVASSDLQAIIKLVHFIAASYLGLAIMFAVHALLLFTNGINPLNHFHKAWPVLTFAFTSRSSAASIPLSIDMQTTKLGIPHTIAGFVASFGATLGQNGCAGLYPAMLAVMVAPTVGIDPLQPMWIMTLVGVTVLSSIGVAGVGGGATFAALIVLPTLGLPTTLVALLISIEPLIDMGRTALNVSGSITAGSLTSRWMGVTNKKILQGSD